VRGSCARFPAIRVLVPLFGPFRRASSGAKTPMMSRQKQGRPPCHIACSPAVVSQWLRSCFRAGVSPGSGRVREGGPSSAFSVLTLIPSSDLFHARATFGVIAPLSHWIYLFEGLGVSNFPSRIFSASDGCRELPFGVSNVLPEMSYWCRSFAYILWTAHRCTFKSDSPCHDLPSAEFVDDEVIRPRSLYLASPAPPAVRKFGL